MASLFPSFSECLIFTHSSASLNSSVLAARRQPRRTPGRGSPRERRVPPAGAVAEVIREKGPTRVQSRCRRPPYPVPSNGPPSAPATDTAPRSKRKKAPRTTDAVRHSGIGPPPPQKKRRGVPHAESPAAWRGGRLLPQPRHLPSGLTTNTNDIGESQVYYRCADVGKRGKYLPLLMFGRYFGATLDIR
ncbi:unnamed protein product [Pleuronectes platessa]|uniref:Uncharacterized protein n=1 Tax=Pleuronectes platessa TaxID=8262 RepID=A0A9N7UHF5_PLEPL|nr:unnamed protein product [Pleuronectes platessa]